MGLKTFKVSLLCAPGVALKPDSKVRLRGHPAVAGAIYKISSTPHDDPLLVNVVKDVQPEGTPSETSGVTTFPFPRNRVELEAELVLEGDYSDANSFGLQAVKCALAEYMGVDESTLAGYNFCVDGHTPGENEAYNDASFAACPPRPRGLPHLLHVSQACVKLQVLELGGASALTSTKFCLPSSIEEIQQSLLPTGDSEPCFMANDRGQPFSSDARPFAANETHKVLLVRDLEIPTEACESAELVEQLRSAKLKPIDLREQDGAQSNFGLPSIQDLASKLPAISALPKVSADAVLASKTEYEAMYATVDDPARADTYRHLPGKIIQDLEKIQALCSAVLDKNLSGNVAELFHLLAPFLEKMAKKIRFQRTHSSEIAQRKTVAADRSLNIFADGIRHVDEEQDEELDELANVLGVSQERKEFLELFNVMLADWEGCQSWMSDFSAAFRLEFDQTAVAFSAAAEKICVEQKVQLSEQYADLDTIAALDAEAKKLYDIICKMIEWSKKVLSGLKANLHAEENRLKEEIKRLTASLDDVVAHKKTVATRESEVDQVKASIQAEIEAFQQAKVAAKKAADERVSRAARGVEAAELCAESLERQTSLVRAELDAMAMIDKMQKLEIGMDCCEAAGGACKYLTVERAVEEGNVADLSELHGSLRKKYFRILQARRARPETPLYTKEQQDEAKGSWDEAKTKLDASEEAVVRFGTQHDHVRKLLLKIMSALRKLQSGTTPTSGGEEEEGEAEETEGNPDPLHADVSPENHQVWAGFGLNAAEGRCFALPDEWEDSFEAEYRTSRENLNAPLGPGPATGTPMGRRANGGLEAPATPAPPAANVAEDETVTPE